ncbi:hypothetical protein CROQUDRAFT_141649 [Cronartium quercuum f. sp. fusiforme G11]|uniref:Uncharacterized protein n=1 Tax=Cronartium quercuum f. sp. fusiforme G11 TaxID=708437 RepID=A0A9P6NZK2_9BASI|nr:hypothetical protein CROQUDRAFT_141649 [Cronartium quercuum f. sp. fusiforme G11]
MKHFSVLIIFLFLIYAHQESCHPSKSENLALNSRSTKTLSQRNQEQNGAWLNVKTNCTKAYKYLPSPLKVGDAINATRQLETSDTAVSQCGIAVKERKKES